MVDGEHRARIVPPTLAGNGESELEPGLGPDRSKTPSGNELRSNRRPGSRYEKVEREMKAKGLSTLLPQLTVFGRNAAQSGG